MKVKKATYFLGLHIRDDDDGPDEDGEDATDDVDDVDAEDFEEEPPFSDVLAIDSEPKLED